METISSSDKRFGAIIGHIIGDISIEISHLSLAEAERDPRWSGALCFLNDK